MSDDGAYAVTAGAGVRNFELQYALAKVERMMPGGTAPSVGIGYTLGGGYSFASRYLGMASDRVIALEVVLANGTMVSSNSSMNSELFWAMRGGGCGSFGVVTSITYKTAPVISGNVSLYNLEFGPSDGVAAADSWQEFFLKQFNNSKLMPQLGLHHHGSASSTGLYFGPVEELRELLTTWNYPRGNVTRFTLDSKSWLEAVLQLGGCDNVSDCLRKAREPEHVKFSAYSAYFSSPVADWSAILKLMQSVECLGCTQYLGVIVDPYGGAINEIAPNATAFPHREKLFHFQILGYMATESERSAVDSWLNQVYWSLRSNQICDSDVYRNYPNLNLSSTNFAKSFFGGNYARLQRVKRSCDPENVFSYPFSIKPAL